MRATGMTVALAVCWLTGVVGAASLPPDDQYSPQQSPYERDAARGPRRLPNWLEYHQDPSTGLESPVNKPGVTSLGVGDLSTEKKSRKDSWTRDLDFLGLGPPRPDLDAPEEGVEMSPASLEDPFEEDDTFQDQGPGSVEVYKLDLRRENSLLVPQAKRRPPAVSSRIKSKTPKKAKAEEILWKVKPVEPSKSSLLAIFRQPPSVQSGRTIPRVPENGKDESFAVGGVPELQVGCEGLEASERKRRSSGLGEEDNDDNDDDDDDHWPKFKDPVYRESTEPILSRVTPIVLDFEDEPPSGQIYEELDELLKLKSSTTPRPTAKRANRGDIDPALENYGHEEDVAQTFPERGDLGSKGGAGGPTHPEDTQAGKVDGVRLPRADNGQESPLNDGESNDTLSSMMGSRIESSNRRGGRKLLWVERAESHENRGRKRHHRDINGYDDPDLWGFGENDGETLNDEEDTVADELRNIEAEKRRREWERRKQEELERRRGGHIGHRPHTPERPSTDDQVNSEIARIREEYERQQEKEQRERQRIAEERLRQGNRRRWDEDRRKMEDARRRQSEESRRRTEEEERRNRDPSYSRGREEEEKRRESNRRREEEERRRESIRQREEEEEEERKLREYMERNRAIDVRPDNQTRQANELEARRRHLEAQRRRQMEDARRRQQDERERRRQMEEQQRRRQMEEQRQRNRPHDDRVREEEEHRRRQMEELRRRDGPDAERAREEEKRRRLEEERKLQEYVRRNQPINVPRKNTSREQDWQEQRRILNEARQWEHNRENISRPKDGRSHGPSAPTDVGRPRAPGDVEESRRRQEAERREAERRRFLEERRRREEQQRRLESWRREEERRRVEAARLREEAQRRRTNVHDTRHRANSTHGGVSRDPGELRRPQTVDNNSRRNQDLESRRRSEERQRQQNEERERMRIERERMRMERERNNGRRRPQPGDTGLNRHGQRDESVRSRQAEEERRRREEARLRALPVSARIIVRSDEAPSRTGGTAPTAPPPPPSISVGTRGGFGNEIDFPAINPNRRGLEAARFPAPPTQRPPTKSPSACVWAIVNCCPANNRVATCFESMGCPGGNWDPSPCRASMQSAAQAEVLSFYESAQENQYTRH